jgi:uncharacterized protein (DUF362 family)
MALAICLSPAFGQDQFNPPVPPPAPPPPPPAPKAMPASLVAVAYNSRALESFIENPEVTRGMVDSLVRTVTGKSDTAAAWKSLVTPEDRVGIKVTATGGRYFSTRKGVVAAVVAGMREAGVKEVFVWDKSAAALREGGFTRERLGCEVRAIDAPGGWDKTASVSAPVLGKLIWGDLQFAEKLKERDADPLSSKSYLATILTRDCTKFINIPALSDEAGCGVAGALYSAVVGNVDNWRRFTTFGEGGAAAIGEIYADPRIGGKCVLHILDALAVTYAGGPLANPQHSVAHASLYASHDPVALDATGLRLMEHWRAEANVAPIGAKATWLSGVAIGQFDQKMIALKPAQ